MNTETVLSHLLRLTTRFAPGLAGRLGWAMFCTPLPLARANPDQRRVLQRAELHPLAFGERKLKVYLWRNGGPRVLLAHGWGGKACSFATLAELLLEQGLEVMALDGPGHDRPGGRTNLLEYSSALRKVSRELGPVHTLVGHSFGAMASAHAAPEIKGLQRLALIGAPHRLDWILEEAQRKLEAPSPVMDFIHRRIEKLSGRPVFEHRTSLYLERTDFQTLVIHDRQDREVPFELAEQLASELGAHWHPTQGLGHRRILKSPEVAQRLAEFVAG